MQEADLILFVVDVRDGITPLDKMSRSALRRLEKPFFLSPTRPMTRST